MVIFSLMLCKNHKSIQCCNVQQIIPHDQRQSPRLPFAKKSSNRLVKSSSLQNLQIFNASIPHFVLLKHFVVTEFPSSFLHQWLCRDAWYSTRLLPFFLWNIACHTNVSTKSKLMSVILCFYYLS